MANASAFGFSGYDPLGSFFEGSMNSYFGNKNANKAMERQKGLMRYQLDLQKQALLELPTVQRQGLINAGYNPMLALGDLPSPSIAPQSSPFASTETGSGDNRFDALAFASAKQAFRAKKAEADLLVDNSKTQQVKNKVERMVDFAKLDALEDEEYLAPSSAVSVKVGLTKMQELLARAFVDEWQLDAKEKQMLNSKEGLRHLLMEKLGSGAHSQIGKTLFDLFGTWPIKKDMIFSPIDK